MAQIKVLRVTAKLLLVASPFMLISGFLTAKPYLLQALDFQTARSIHTVIVPLAFVPLLLVHSTAGILYLLGRNKKLKTPSIRTTAAVGWNVLILGLCSLYFIGSPPAVDLDIPDDVLESESPGGGDAGVPQAGESSDSDVGPTPSVDGGSRSPADQRNDGAVDGSTDTGAAHRRDAETVAMPAKTPPSRSGKSRRTKRRAKRSVDRTAKITPPPHQTEPDQPEPLSGHPPEEKAPPQPKLSGSALVKRACAGCHPLSTVYGTKRTPSDWRSTMARMMGMGAQLNPEERGVVLRHLISRAGMREE